MKKVTFLSIVFTLAAYLVSAQPSNRVSAWNYLKSGDLKKAKEKIDKAINHPKTSKDPRTWYYRGLIYQELAITKNPKYKSLVKDPLDTAFYAFEKALKYNFKNPELQKIDFTKPEGIVKFMKALRNRKTKYVDREITMKVFMNYPALGNSFFNKGVKNYNKKDYNKSFDNFEKSLYCTSFKGTPDTVVTYYAGLAAKKAGKYDKALEYFKLAKQLKYGKTDKDKILLYKLLAETYLDKKDTANYIKTMKEGISAYPSESALLLPDLINYYLNSKQNDAALNYLNMAIEKDSTNPTYYYARGNMYDLNLKQHDKAEADYKKAIELKPDFYDAVYSLGAMLYNTGVEILKKADDVQDLKKYNKMKSEALDYFKKALPYLEKAHELKPDDINPLISLKIIYYRLGKTDKYEEIKKQLDAMEKKQ